MPYLSTLTSSGFWILAVLVTALPASIVESQDGDQGYVLLADWGVIRGSVREIPGQIIITQGDNEIRLRRDRVCCWAPNLAGLHRYLIDNRQGSTIDSHLDVAKWCLRNRFPAGATAELIAVLRVEPNHAEANRLVQDLKNWNESQAAEDDAKADRSAGGTDPPSGSPNGSPVASDETTPDGGTAAEGSDFDAVVKSQILNFNRSIQPILINQCGQAACHGNPTHPGFVITGPQRGHDRPGAETSRSNLITTLKWVDTAKPASSPLLVRALRPHGASDSPPLGPQDRIAVNELRAWVMQLSNSYSSLPTSRIASAGSLERKQPGDPADRRGPTRLPEIDDPFDPEVFNRLYHPKRR
jgi:hypothetical protein